LRNTKSSHCLFVEIEESVYNLQKNGKEVMGKIGNIYLS
jgi:hypothetical protein